MSQTSERKSQTVTHDITVKKNSETCEKSDKNSQTSLKKWQTCEKKVTNL